VLSSSVSQDAKGSPVPDERGSVSTRCENLVASASWDKLVSGFPDRTTFHSSAWAQVLSQTYGFVPVYLIASRGNNSISALPLMEVTSWLTGRRGISLPFTDECGGLGATDSCLVDEALRIGRGRGWKHVEFRGGRGLFNGTKPSVQFLGHQLKLCSNTARLFEQLESSVRRAIHKAEKAGLTIEISQTLDATHDYFALHGETRRKHGLPPQPIEFFRQIHTQIIAQQRGVIISAKFEGQVVASAIFFHDDAEAIYKFGASNAKGEQLRANNFVMWEAIKWHAQKGLNLLRFGRTSPTNEGLRRYKLGWGAEEYLINYYKYDLRKDALVSQKDEAIAWYNRIFRHLPMPLLRRTGALLYRHIA
jgi:hypothetical protein